MQIRISTKHFGDVSLDLFVSKSIQDDSVETRYTSDCDWSFFLKEVGHEVHTANVLFEDLSGDGDFPLMQVTEDELEYELDEGRYFLWFKFSFSL